MARGDSRTGEGLLEHAQRETERLATLGTLVACVAHEVNNPITYVLGNLSELERTLDSLDQALAAYRSEPSISAEVHAEIEAKRGQTENLEVSREILADTLEGAERIRDLVRDLLQLAHPAQRGAPSVNPHEVIESTLGLMGRRLASVAEIVRDFQATQWVAVDRARLGGVMLNLLSNALHACTPGDPSQQRIEIRSRDVAGGIEIEVEDSGRGVSPAEREQIFAAFFTTKSEGEGHGLGLFISRKLMEESGGALSFRVGEGGGTIFCIRAPATADAQSDSHSVGR